jgi:hypothetical protein
MARRTLRVAGKDVMPVDLREVEIGCLREISRVSHDLAFVTPMSVNNAVSSPA